MNKLFNVSLKVVGLLLAILGCSMAVGCSRDLVRDIYCRFQGSSADWCQFSDLPWDKSLLMMLAIIFGCVLFNVRMKKLGLRDMFREVGVIWIIVFITIAGHMMLYL